MTTTTIRCARCSQVLGERRGQMVKVKHRGREIEALVPVVIKCESCGASCSVEGG